VRIPPVRVARPATRRAPAPRDHGLPIAFEDDALLVVNKPAGLAVHGGSGISFGVIERLRAARPQARVLELAHRLDRETSGLLIVAKKRSALTALHAALREGRVGKRYLVLVKGAWTGGARNVVLPLRKYVTSAGERRVSVEEGGQESRTRFERVRECDGFTLLAARLDTGRTHQIRVQLAHLGFPVAGDDKYGDFELNRELARRGLKRMFLHAAELELEHPTTGTRLALTAPLPDDLQRFLDGLAHRTPHHAAPI
jgi:23S rRNA pseudouridine955/2504/2580 synthase